MILTIVKKVNMMEPSIKWVAYDMVKVCANGVMAHIITANGKMEWDMEMELWHTIKI